MSDPTKLRPSSKASSDKTMAQSVDPSVHDTKLATETMPSPATSIRHKSAEDLGEKPAKDVDLEEVDKGATEKVSDGTSQEASTEEDDFVYPKAWTLAAITLALCLSVFCMALVCFVHKHLTILF